MGNEKGWKKLEDRRPKKRVMAMHIYTDYRAYNVLEGLAMIGVIMFLLFGGAWASTSPLVELYNITTSIPEVDYFLTVIGVVLMLPYILVGHNLRTTEVYVPEDGSTETEGT